MFITRRYRKCPNLIALAGMVCITLFALAGCRRQREWEGHTFTVQYAWDGKMQLLGIKDAASNREIDDPVVETKVLEEGNRVLPAWVRLNKLTRAKGTFHIRFLANHATEIVETSHGIEGATEEFIRDPDTTALMIAAHEARMERLQELINEGEKVNATDQLGNTALMAAVSSMNIEVLRLLLDHGADVNARNLDGETALTLSAFSGQADMMKELTHHGAAFDCQNATDRATLFTAEKRREVSVVSFLKKIGGNCGLANPSS
jgi:ankyrin repeat protein